MRGPNDQADQPADITSTTEGVASYTASEKRPRPPGGKALYRQINLLESAGYLQLAREQLNASVSDDNREQAVAFHEQFVAAAGGDVVAETALGAAPENLAANVANEYLQTGQLLGPPTGTGPQWRSLGPSTVPNGQTYGSARVNISGRVSAIAVDPQNPAHVLVGAANGGVWESPDRGQNWSPRTDYAPTLTVGAIAFDPSNPTMVYCGTGEGNWWSYLGAGVMRSTDNGATWTLLCTAPFVGQGFYDLLVDSSNSQNLIAATTGGIYTSTDGGVTWTQRRSTRTWSLAVSRIRRRRVEFLAACSDGLFHSEDGGVTWTAVTLPGAGGTFNRLAVAVAPSDQTVAYAWGSLGSSALLWRRAAGTWTAMNAPAGINIGQAWYDWFLAVSPDRADQIYIGAIDAYRGDLSGATFAWIDITTRAVGASIHPDQHAIAFEPGNPNFLYIGNDGGLFRSPDRGVTWQHCNNGLVISEFEYLAQDFGSSRWIMGGTQDNGTERWTGSAVWDHIADGDGGDCGVNRNNPANVFHTYYGMSPERSTSRGDFGTWSGLSLPIPAGEGSLFYPPFETCATDGDTIAIGGGAIYVSSNNGGAWTRVAFPTSATATAMYIPNATTVFVGTNNGAIYKTTLTGSTWSASSALTTPRAGAFVSDLYVDPNNLNRIWVTYRTVGGGRVFRSDDGGVTWVDCSAGLPGLPINAIEVDTWNNNRVWVAADLGVYQTLDGGSTWANFSNGLPNAYIGDLVFHPHARVLRAGTRNRGVWEIPVDGWLTGPICGIQFVGRLNANETRRWFTFNWPATWHVVWTVMPVTVKNGAPEITWNVQVERASNEYVTYWISVTNLTSVQVDFEGRYCILSRY
jgi:photosystem II stability/assembly factor-like uncharacterized protein